tara:strand:+ start:33 stop:461 length:429 start_codon:yes stop_codon:yes gene_type:complete
MTNKKCFIYKRIKDEKVPKSVKGVVLYPENLLTLEERMNYTPFDAPIMTEDPWLIASYDKSEVAEYSYGEWNTPDEQTYGSSYEYVAKQYLGLNSTIPKAALTRINTVLGESKAAVALEWIEKNVGTSMEKVFLCKQLESKE